VKGRGNGGVSGEAILAKFANRENGTALKRSKGWLGFLVVAVPCVWGLYFWLRDWTLAGIAACMSVYLVVEAWNVVRTKSAARKDPTFLKKNGPGA